MCVEMTMYCLNLEVKRSHVLHSHVPLVSLWPSWGDGEQLWHILGYRVTPKEGAALPALLTAASGRAAPANLQTQECENTCLLWQAAEHLWSFVFSTDSLELNGKYAYHKKTEKSKDWVKNGYYVFALICLSHIIYNDFAEHEHWCVLSAALKVLLWFELSGNNVHKFLPDLHNSNFLLCFMDLLIWIHSILFFPCFIIQIFQDS